MCQLKFTTLPKIPFTIPLKTLLSQCTVRVTVKERPTTTRVGSPVYVSTGDATSRPLRATGAPVVSVLTWFITGVK